MPALNHPKKSARIRARQTKIKIAKLMLNKRIADWKAAAARPAPAAEKLSTPFHGQAKDAEAFEQEVETEYARLERECAAIDPEDALSLPFDDEFQKHQYERRGAERWAGIAERELWKSVQRSDFVLGAWRSSVSMPGESEKEGEDMRVALSGTATMTGSEREFGEGERSMAWE